MIAYARVVFSNIWFVVGYMCCGCGCCCVCDEIKVGGWKVGHNLVESVQGGGCLME